jgi:hypothetical protein
VSDDKRPPIPLRQAQQPGIYRRRIVLEAEGDGVTGWLEDDFHCFGATLRHDGERVVSLRGEANRWPWTTCPAAVNPLELLVGARLSTSLREIARGVDPRAQCTHLFDVALLAIAHAARGGPRRSYDAAIPDRVQGRTRATLHRDGQPVLAWELDRGTITSPEPFAGRLLQGGRLNAWIDAHFEGDSAEAALVLRRACTISIGRRYDFDRIARAETFAHELGAGACYTFGESVLPNAERVVGSVRDFSECAEEMRIQSEPSEKGSAEQEAS